MGPFTRRNGPRGRCVPAGRRTLRNRWLAHSGVRGAPQPAACGMGAPLRQRTEEAPSARSVPGLRALVAAIRHHLGILLGGVGAALALGLLELLALRLEGAPRLGGLLLHLARSD